MAILRHRYDGYGRPLPRLAEVPRRTLATNDVNIEHQGLIRALLQEFYDALLVPGVHAEVCLRFTIHDGVISREIFTERCQQHRSHEEDFR